MDATVNNTVNVATVVNAAGLTASVVGTSDQQAAVSYTLPIAVVVPPTQNINIITVSGPQGPIGPPGTGSITNLTGQYPIFYDAGSGIVGIVSGYYVTFPDLTSASGALVAQISAAAAGVNAINGISGFVTLAAQNPLFISVAGQTITISGSGLVTSGDLTRYYLSSNPQAYATSGDLSATGSYLYNLITGGTGAPANLSGYITTGQADLRYYPLTTNPSGYVTTGQTGQFYPSSNPQGYAPSGFTTGASGALQAQIGLLPTTAQLAQTGSDLYHLITGESGQGVIDYATKVQLTQSGVDLTLYINGVGINLSGNLAQSGIQLMLRDSSISGVLQGYINSLAGGTGNITTNVVYTSGTQFISGVKYFIGNTYIDNLFVTGTQTVINTQDLYVADNWIVMNATGAARDSALFISTGFTGVAATGAVIGWDVPSNSWRFGLASQQTDLFTLPAIASGEAVDAANARITSLSGFTVGMSGGLETRIAQTGAAGVAYANGVSGGLEVRITATGNAAISHANSIGQTVSGNLTLTGQTLRALTLGGDANLSGNLGATGTLLSAVRVSGSSIINNANFTGLGSVSVFWSGDKIFVSGLVGNGAGDVTQAQLNALSGFTTGMSGYLQGQIALTGQQAWTAANNNGINLSGQLNSLSGQAENIYVHRTGDELISGSKTISGNLYVTSGRMGVGTTSPTVPLHVVGDGIPLVVDSTDNQIVKIRFRENASNVGGLLVDSTFALGVQDKNGFDRFAVTQPGLVGIGTTTPQQLLHVTGVIRSDAGFMSGNSKLEDILYPRSNPQQYVTSGNLAALSGYNESIYVHRTGNELISGNKTLSGSFCISGGRLGVGTLSPSFMAHIVGNNAVNALLVDQEGGSEPILRLASNGQTRANWTTLSDAIMYLYGTNAFIYPLVVREGGKIGMGTISPAENLHVTGAVRTDTAFLSGGVNIADILYPRSNPSGYALDNLVIHRTGNELITGTKTWNGSAYYTTGRVGIGTTSPQSKLHINLDQNLQISDGLRISQDTLVPDRFIQINAYDSISNIIAAGPSSTHGALALKSYNGSAIRTNVYVDESGNMGIGTAVPINTLDVAGVSYFESNLRFPSNRKSTSFDFTTPSYRYIWSGAANCTGTLPLPSAISGIEYMVKNLSATNTLTISGLVDYTQNTTVAPLQHATFWSDNSSWISI